MSGPSHRFGRPSWRPQYRPGSPRCGVASDVLGTRSATGPLPARHAHASCGLANAGVKKKEKNPAQRFLGITFSPWLFMAIQFQRVSRFGSVLSALTVPACVAFRSSSDPRSRATHSNKVDSIFKKRSMNGMNTMLPLPLKKTPCPHWIYFALADATFAS